MAKANSAPSDFMGHQIFGLPVDREILLSNHKNVYKKRIEKRQRKLIVKLTFLKPFLKKGEKILLITTGYSPLFSGPVSDRISFCLSQTCYVYFYELSNFSPPGNIYP